MKSKKWLNYTLGVLITLIVLTAVAGAGFRAGMMQNALFSRVENGARPFAHDVFSQMPQSMQGNPHGNKILGMTGNFQGQTVEVDVEGHRRSASAVGNGPLDAAMKAADAALGFELQLLEMHTRPVTAGKDALAEVSVRVVHDGIESLGQAASHDTIEATLKAYLSAVAGGREARAAA